MESEKIVKSVEIEDGPMHYRIVLNEILLDQFLAFLPEPEPLEVYYICLFGRHKYDPAFPNTKDSGQLVRAFASDKCELKEKIWRMETPVGSYTRNGIAATQESLAVYLALNPKSLVIANKKVLVEMATRIADGHLDFNPVSVANTEIHRAVGTKRFLDFDFDDVNPDDYQYSIQSILPDPEMYRILKTRGGFHLIVLLERIKALKTKWHQSLCTLPKCDIKGTNTLTPVPGCTQGGYVPHFV